MAKLPRAAFVTDERVNLDLLVQAYVACASKTAQIPARPAASASVATVVQAANPGVSAILAPYFQYQSKGYQADNGYHSKFSVLIDYNERQEWMFGTLDAIGLIPGVSNVDIPLPATGGTIIYAPTPFTEGIDTLERAIWHVATNYLFLPVERITIGTESYLKISVDETFTIAQN